MEIYFKDTASMEAFKKIATQEILDTAKIGVWLPPKAEADAKWAAAVAWGQQRAMVSDDESESESEDTGARTSADERWEKHCAEVRAKKAAPAVVNTTVPSGPLRTDNEADIEKVMKEMHMDWQDAWTYIRCIELEEGASICCSEECEDNDSAIDELVYSAQIGKAKRNARRRAMGRATSDNEDEDKTVEETKPYVAPPRIRYADHYWPYARCKNIVREIMGANKVIPRSHFELLTYIANIKRVSLETLKKTSPFEYFKGDARVTKTLTAMSYKGLCRGY